MNPPHGPQKRSLPRQASEQLRAACCEFGLSGAKPVSMRSCVVAFYVSDAGANISASDAVVSAFVFSYERSEL